MRLKGILAIDYVVPDYYALRPKKCMGGWGRQFFNISPAGKILPCHAAETITGLEFLSVRSNHSIAWIWQNSEAFNRYRGTGWMKEPCKSCEFREIDFGGCRCQAFALTGMPAIPIRPARSLRCIERSSSRPSAKPPPTITVSSIAISPAARWRRKASMAPDADAGKAAKRADPFAPLTSEQLVVGDGHDIYVESVGRIGGIPAVYLHGGPGSAASPTIAGCSIPNRFHAVLFDQRGAGRSRPKGCREHDTLPHCRGHGDDSRKIRLRTLDDRRRLVGATLALAYARAHPTASPVSCCAPPSRYTRGSGRRLIYVHARPPLIRPLYEDFLSSTKATDRCLFPAYANSAVHSPAARFGPGKTGTRFRHRAEPL